MRLLRSIALATTLIACHNVHAGITLDFSHDAASDNFFGTNAAARAAVEAAVADVNAALNFSLGQITASDDVITGTNGGTSASFDFNFSYTNPSTGASQSLSSLALGFNEIRIYAGMRELSGSTLGQGGPGGWGFSFGGSGSPSQWNAAVADAESQANLIYQRGSGPIISTISGSSTLGTSTASYSLSRGVTHGSLWFDTDSDDNGISDLTEGGVSLDDYWHFDHTTPVEAGKNDFYSVALHETLHAIGIGTAESWEDLVSGNDWLGAEVISEYGSGTGLIDSSHVTEGIMSTRLSDGAAQEIAMDPTLTLGTRKQLTSLDIAFLRDIGFSSVASVPEPTAVFPMVLLGVTLLYRRRR